MKKLAALFIFPLLIFGCGPERRVEGPPPPLQAPAGEGARAPSPGELVELIHVTDGDTIYVWRWHGLEARATRERIRMLGVNAPELGTAAGEKAKADLVKKLSGKKIFLVFPRGEIRDKWGRLLAEVKTE